MPVCVEPEAKATLTATHEPSGEIRLALKYPPRRTCKITPPRFDEYGMPEASPLVYRLKVGESPRSHGGQGSLPRETEFGRAGKRAVKSAAGALESIYGRNTLFGTVTLAGSTPQACAMLAAWSGRAVELLRKWLQYNIPGCAFVYVWEWQKRGALHLHLAVGSFNSLAMRKAKANFKTYIHKLHEKLSELSGTDMFEREDGGSWRGFPDILRSRLETVRKSVKRYLAKYLSKGGTTAGAYCPSRWWGCTNNLRFLVRTLRRQFRVHLADIGLADSLYWHHRRCVAEAEYVSFSWQTPYSALQQTTAVYPPEEDADSHWASIVALLENCPGALRFECRSFVVPSAPRF